MFQFPQKMKKVFRDEDVQNQFEKNGYVILDFYTPEEVQYLLSLYKNLHPQDEKGFYPSTFSKDKKYRITADEEIRRVGSRSINQYLEDVKIVCGSFIIKSPGEDSIMDVHQDMTLVDESEFTGINIWCPLVDLTDDNGLLFALPESHRFAPTYRGASLPTLYKNVYDEIRQFSTPMYLKAGQAIFFDQSILHWSKPNLSNTVRPVTNTYFTHKDARFQICYLDKSINKVEVFEQDDSFMTNFEQFGENIYDKPKIGTSKGYFEYDFPELTREELMERFGIKEEPMILNSDKKSFFEIYTLPNIFNEIKGRLKIN